MCYYLHPTLPARLSAQAAGGRLRRRGVLGAGVVRAPRGKLPGPGGELSAGRAAFPPRRFLLRRRLLCSLGSFSRPAPLLGPQGLHTRCEVLMQPSCWGNRPAELGFRGPSGLPVTEEHQTAFFFSFSEGFFIHQHFLEQEITVPRLGHLKKNNIPGIDWALPFLPNQSVI